MLYKKEINDNYLKIKKTLFSSHEKIQIFGNGSTFPYTKL